MTAYNGETDDSSDSNPDSESDSDSGHNYQLVLLF